ncbi:MAG: DedA family protein [Gammaproteobacteria bacterium]|nr:DedA family protein [Gammaproteobacteria bacterium]
MLENLIREFGYLAVAIGTFLEGETVLALGAVAAQRGYLVLQWVITSALIGTWLGDQLFFWLGRIHGHAWLDRRESWKQRAERVLYHVHRHQNLLIFGYRWLYGLRSITPFVIGMSGIAPWKFALLDAIGVAVWAVVIGVLGYTFGSAVELLVGDIHDIEKYLLAALVIAGLLAWGVRRQRMRAAARRN